MSLTQADEVFVALHEDGANDLLTAFFNARPRYFNYRSSSVIPGPPAAPGAWTTIPPISFPGVGAIDWGVQFRPPRIDFFPDSSGGMPPPLTLAPDHLSVRTKVLLTLMCGPGRGRDQKDRSGTLPLRAALDVWGVGHIVSHYYGPGTGEIGFVLDQVEIVDITPDPLESLLECLIRMLLNGALSAIRIPFHALSAGAFSLSLTRGPTVESDQVKLWGTIA